MERLLNSAGEALRRALTASRTSCVEDLLLVDVKRLAAQAGVSIDEVLALQRAAATPPRSHRVCDLYRLIKRGLVLETGCKRLDILLGGGLKCGEVLEFAGEWAVGKTQLCIMVAVHTVLTDSTKSIAYVDSSLGLVPARVASVAAARVRHAGGSGDILDVCIPKIRVFRAFDVDELMYTISCLRHQLEQQANEFANTLKLLIIDSIPAAMSAVIGSADGHASLIRLSHALKSLAAEFSIAVVVTNNLLFSHGTNATLRPALGQAWSYLADTRLQLERPGDADLTTPHPTRRIFATLTKHSHAVCLLGTP